MSIRIPQNVDLSLQNCLRDIEKALGELSRAIDRLDGSTTLQRLAADVDKITADIKEPRLPDDRKVFVGSGPMHAVGLVPDPGATPGTTKFLREDGTWVPDMVLYYPSSLTTVAGTLASGVVADVAIIGGNNIHIEEVASTPGFDIIFEFTAVTRVPRSVHVVCYYNGNHAPKIQGYEYSGAAWVTLETIIDSGGAQDMHSFLLPLDSRFISGGAMRLRFNHDQNGSTAHDLLVDYIAVVG